MSEDKVYYESERVYLHVGNGGFSFQVVDEGFGPTIVFTHAFFGHEAVTKIHTERLALHQLSEMFKDASDHHPFTETYCEAARAEVGKKKLAELADA